MIKTKGKKTHIIRREEKTLTCDRACGLGFVFQDLCRDPDNKTGCDLPVFSEILFQVIYLFHSAIRTDQGSAFAVQANVVDNGGHLL